MASTTFDLPHPFGPTMQVIPLPLNRIGVFPQNDLNPSNSTLRSLSTGASHSLLPWPHRQKKLRFGRPKEEVFRDKNVGGREIDGPSAWRYDFGGYHATS
jgi:hypothetical protein